MKLIDRYEFASGKVYETFHIETPDVARDFLSVPECSTIAFMTQVNEDHQVLLTMRPDESLILARMLIDAVSRVMS